MWRTSIVSQKLFITLDQIDDIIHVTIFKIKLKYYEYNQIRPRISLSYRAPWPNGKALVSFPTTFQP